MALLGNFSGITYIGNTTQKTVFQGMGAAPAGAGGIQFGQSRLIPLRLEGNVTASGDISASATGSFGSIVTPGTMRISKDDYAASHLLDLSGSQANGEMILVRGNKGAGGTIRYQRGTSYSWRAGVGGGSSTNSNIPSSYWGIEDVSDSNTVAIAVAHSTQNVGIGTTNPGYTLEVSSGTTNEIARFASTDDDGLISVGDDNDMTYVGYDHSAGIMSLGFDNGMGSNNISIRSDGKVGIGTTAPTANLEVRGTGAIAMFSGSSYTIEFDHAGQEKFDLSHGTSGIYWRKSNTIIGGWTQNHDFSLFNSSGNQYANFDGSEGKVHIGGNLTSAPPATLHISGAGYTNLSVEGDITASGNISGSSTSTIRVGGAITTAGQVSAEHLMSTDDIQIQGDLMTLGNQASGFKMFVNNTNEGASHGGDLIISGGAAFGTPGDDRDGGDVKITGGKKSNSGTDGNVILAPNIGKVGIGTTSPSYPLHVSGSEIRLQKPGNDAIITSRTDGAGAYFIADSNSSNYAGFQINHGGSGVWFLGGYASADFNIVDGPRNTGHKQLIIENSTGNVKIQTGSLHLLGQAGGHITASGNISASGTITSNDCIT